MNKKIVSALVLFMVVLAGAIYFTHHTGQRENSVDQSSQKKVAVEVTFYPLAEFTQQVGGEHVSVNTLVPAGTEPHEFEPTTQDIARMHSAKVFIYNGAGFEGWLNKVLPDLQKSGVTTVDSSQGMKLITADPHIWLDPVLAQQQVRTIAQVLAKIDPEHASDYQQRSDAYIGRLQKLDMQFQSGLQNCNQRTIVTSHAAFAYLAKEYRLDVLPISGLSPDEEPSPQRLSQIVQEVKQNHIKYIFFESLVQPTLANTIASETGAQTLVFNPLEGLTPADSAAGKEYISVQQDNLFNLRTALQCQ